MSDQPLNVLFLCTGNSARSILGEAILNQDGEGRFKAYSAGSNPIGTVNPWAIHTLKTLGYPADGYSSKSWSEFAEGPEFDLIFTVCDSAAEAQCPVFPGAPLRAHWGLDDPASAAGPAAAQRAAFLQSYRHLTARATAFVNLPFEQMSAGELAPVLAAIGRMDGATPMTLERAA